MIELWPHQKTAKDALVKTLQRERAALDASDTGTGKTMVAAAVAAELRLPVGVVCPKAVIPAWKKALAEWGVTPEFILNYEMLRGGKTPHLKLVGSTYDWTLKSGLLIFDEVHMCKAPDSANARMLMATRRTANLVLCLSATAAQSPLDMNALGLVLRLHNGPEHDFWPWAVRLGVKRGRFRQMKFSGSRQHLAELHNLLFPGKGTRVRAEDLGSLFPDNLVTADEFLVDNWEELAQVYQDTTEEIERIRERAENDRPSIFTALLRARQIAETYKVPVLEDLTNEFVEEGKSVAIFANFDATLDMLQERLKTDCVVRGEQAAEAREQAIQDFQNNRKPVILCNVQAGGVGISLHDLTGERPRVSLLCPTFNAIHLKQALGRIHRAGGKSKCIQKIIFASNTVEEVVCTRLRNKLKNIDLINDQDLEEIPIWQTTVSS